MIIVKKSVKSISYLGNIFKATGFDAVNDFGVAVHRVAVFIVKTR
jgi:hypothetical protein